MTDQNKESFEVRRYDFLKTMYSEMWGNVNRHLMLIWQSVGVLGAALAVFSLTEKNVLSLDVASSVVVLLCAWLIANAYVASAWFNRNQAIISNIERQFLKSEDLIDIQPYFQSRRKLGDMTEHVELQWLLGVSLGISVLVGDFVTEIWPFLNKLCSLTPMRVLPFVTGVMGAIACLYFRRRSLAGERGFLESCPIRIEDTGIK
jgi:low affinity Fe/Cu permease